MLRTFNYTGRKKIPRQSVKITLTGEKQGPRGFDATFELASLRLPDHARVYVEAYYKSSYMRFPFGQVSDIHAPKDRRLTELDGGATALFRVKVIDESGEHGKVLAEADGICPVSDGDVPSDRTPLLPVVIRDLGFQLWRLEFDEPKPILVLNSLVDELAFLARSDDRFFSLVYPAVVERILVQIVREEKYYDLDGPDDDWRCAWLKFACQGGIRTPPTPPDENHDDDSFRHDLADWIEEAVEAFCQRYQARERFVQGQGARGGR